MSKPIAVINVAKLSNTEIDQPTRLHEAGYLVFYVNEGPAIMLHQAAPGRRERIATTVYAGLCANDGLNHKSMLSTVEMAVSGADLLMKELDK